MTERHSYVRWKKHHPNFDLNDYIQWVKSRGYYRSALDTSKPEFYEYASVYLGLAHSIAMQQAHTS